MKNSREKLWLLADEDLLEKVAAMDSDAFEVIYDRHIKATYSLAYRFCGKASEADDICQETFVSVWRASSRYSSSLGSVRNWLLSITHNRAIDHIRKATRYQERHVQEDPLTHTFAADDNIEEEVLTTLSEKETKKMLDTLPREQKQVVELAFYSGYSQSEIAEHLELPLGTVKGRVRLGLEKLKGNLLEAAAA
jgi:RNA polymerase sigma-70 factor (ECF subfamily)